MEPVPALKLQLMLSVGEGHCFIILFQTWFCFAPIIEIDKGEKAVAIVMDMSKAFDLDSDDHSILVKKAI